jgi:ribosomal-protein-alanine N-acetyltransferase
MAAQPDDFAPRPSADDLLVTITPMRRRHLRGVLRIEHQVYPRPWSVGLYMSELSFGPTRLYLVARVDSVVVGYAGLMIVGDDGHITTVAVEPSWHRNHIATRILVAVVREAIIRGVRNLTLEVRVSNSGAQALYGRFGFAPAGARKAYYIDNHEDALVMWAHDIDMPEYGDRIDAIEAGIRGRTVVEGLS